MSAQHTPGPWRVTETSIGAAVVSAATGHTVVTAEGLCNQADAPRLAAAPDLLAALEHIANEPIGDSEASFREVHDAIVGIARAALAKAREG